MAERKTGAGSRLSSVLERSTPLSPPDEPEEPESPVPAEVLDGETASATRGRGAAPKKPRPVVEARASRRIKGRTIYLPDDLFERILVQAHRRGKTISDYVATILDRQIPDHRVIRAEPPEGEPPARADQNNAP